MSSTFEFSFPRFLFPPRELLLGFEIVSQVKTRKKVYLVLLH